MDLLWVVDSRGQEVRERLGASSSNDAKRKSPNRQAYTTLLARKETVLSVLKKDSNVYNPSDTRPAPSPPRWLDERMDHGRTAIFHRAYAPRLRKSSNENLQHRGDISTRAMIGPSSLPGGQREARFCTSALVGHTAATNKSRVCISTISAR